MVGQGSQRRTVLCFRNQLLDPQGFETRKQQQQTPVKSWRSNGYTTQQKNDNDSSGSRKRVTEICKMGVKKHISESRLSKSNSVDLYRPPALRNNSHEDATETHETPTTAGAAAVPVASAIHTPTTTTTSALVATPLHSNNNNDNSSEQHKQQAVNAAAAAAAATRRERRPDRAVYVPRARRSQTTPPTATVTATTTAVSANPAATSTLSAVTMLPTCNPQQLEAAAVVDANSTRADDSSNLNQQSKPKKSKTHRERRERSKKIATAEKPTDATVLMIEPSETIPTSTETITDRANQAGQATTPAKTSNNCDKEAVVDMGGGSKHTKSTKTHGKVHSTAPLRIEDVAAAVSNATAAENANKGLVDSDVRELQRASKEINRSNRRIMKQTFVSDVLEIPDKIEAATVAATTTPSTTAIAATDSNTEGEYEDGDEDDWENMFDESGECLDPKILQELAESVGKCKIELPKMDYSVYHVKQSLLNDEEYPHVLEISNFPMEFKTPDLLMLFSQYKGSGFDIKWVDDTHALAVFSSSRIAAEVLTTGHPFVKVKPLAEATLESRLKAKKCAGSLQPYRQRPETCTALARRLVSGALGVKLPNAPEERENERRVLRQAKERKLLAAKQRDEAWES